MTNDSSSIKPVNPAANLWDIVTAPSLALERVSTIQTRSWWLPALLALIAPILHIALTLDLQIERIESNIALRLSVMPAEQANAARPMMERMLQPNVLLFSTFTQVAVGLLLSWALAMLILYFGIALLGKPPKSAGLWSAIIWAWIPFAIRPLVQLAWNAYTHSLVYNPGATYFVATGNVVEDQQNPLYVAATQIDMFSVWHIILIYVLLRVVGKLGRGGSLFMTALYMILMLGIHVLPSILTKLAGAE